MTYREKWRSLGKERILLLLLTGVLLVIISWPAGKGEETPLLSKADGNQADVSDADQSDTDASEVEERLERRLEEILSQVEGVGKVKAMITLKSSGRELVEKDQAESNETTVFQRDSQGKEIPFVFEKTLPEVEGVLVLLQGGSAVTVNEITEAIMTLFHLEAHKIKVMKME